MTVENMTFNEVFKKANEFADANSSIRVSSETLKSGMKFIQMTVPSMGYDKEFYLFLRDLETNSLYHCTGYTVDDVYEEHIMFKDFIIHFMFRI